jgi:cell division protein FtsA
MSTDSPLPIIAALDIGTSKVAVLVAEILPDRSIRVIGKGEAPSSGLRKGMVDNIEKTTETILKTIAEAEADSKNKISRVITGIAGSHIKNWQSSGTQILLSGEVTQADIDAVIKMARGINISGDQTLLHAIPQEFVIDGQDKVITPLGMSGQRLEAKVNLVTGQTTAVENITKCIKRSGLVVDEVILQPLASNLACLTDDDRQLGVVLVDIGAGTTDVAIFSDGAVRYTECIPVGGTLFTNDIAAAVRTSIKEAEEIKHRFGVAKRQLADERLSFDVKGLGDVQPRSMTQVSLAQFIETRAVELFQLILTAINSSGYRTHLHSGVVLTGGASLMRGMCELSEEVMHIPTRLGYPRYDGPLDDLMRNPRYSTGMGLLLYARDAHVQANKVLAETPSGLQVLTTMKKWFKANF